MRFMHSCFAANPIAAPEQSCHITSIEINEAVQSSLILKVSSLPRTPSKSFLFVKRSSIFTGSAMTRFFFAQTHSLIPTFLYPLAKGK